MEDTLRIKCPFDGSILTVRNQPGIEDKSLTCPICKNKFRFKEYKILPPERPYEEDGGTDLPGDITDRKSSNDELNFTLGKLTVLNTGASFRLRPGKNIIGRKASKSGADIQIDTAGAKSMSREHILIEIKKVPGKGYVHYVSLFKERVNKTYIGKEELLYGDCLVLADGDLLRLPDATLRFEIPDDEGTDM